MKTALGGLSWKPAEFWQSTLTEFFVAIDGQNEANGTNSSGPSQDEVAKAFAKMGK